MPTRYPEAFGIVMAEAMACGTPVIGTPRGAVPEVVEEGVSGFVGKDVDDFVAAVDRIDELDRTATRERCERLFSDRAVVDGYETLYREMVNGKQ
jgi:glycosyltransferase involved in cell wall biosynthesis